MPISRGNRLAFGAVTVACAAAALLYIYYSARGARRALVQVAAPAVAKPQLPVAPAPIPLPEAASSDSQMEMPPRPTERPGSPPPMRPAETKHRSREEPTPHL